MSSSYIRTISDYFEESAKKNSAKVAITDSNGSYTYGELKKYSDRVAQTIVNNGIDPEKRIAIYMSKSGESVATMLGILKAGCSYMFIDVKFPNDRVWYMINDSKAEAVITDRELPDNETDIKVFDIKRIIRDQFDAEVIRRAEPGYGAYIIYTSGSTGKPKGLMVSNENFIGLYEAWGKEHLRVGAYDEKASNIAVIAPFSFDMCVLMIYGTLFMGNHLFIIPDESKKDGNGIVDYIDDNQIEIMDATPNYIRLMNDALSSRTFKNKSLKRVLCIGDVFGKSLAEQLLWHMNEADFEVYNTYGPAECTVLMTWIKFTLSNINDYEVLPIGRVTDNAGVVIVDENLQPVKDGEVGELIILGDCVGLGYISSHVKKPGPFGVYGEKSYRTGDLVRADKDGCLYFIGRVDRQCKINGYRVELEEIEHRLEKYDGVKEARIVVKKEDDGFSRMFAFYTGTPNDDLRMRLREELPYYMVPQEFSWVEKFPVSPNGKVDYKKLIEDFKNKEEVLEVGDYIKKRVAESIGSREEDLDFDSSFYSLGGDSITLLSLVSSISDKYKLKISISSLMQSESINKMIEYIRGLEKVDTSDCKEESSSIQINESQRKLYEVYRKSNGLQNRGTDGLSLVYRICFDEKIDIDFLERIIDEEIRNNEVFSCVLEKRRNKVYLTKTDKTPKVRIQKFDDTDELNRKLKNDLSNIDEILSLYLVDDKTIIIRFSHVLIDFMSAQYFMKDIVDGYSNKKMQERKAVTSYMAGNVNCDEECLDYWAKELSDVKRTVLPGDSNGEHRICLHTETIGTDLYRSIINTASLRAGSVFSVVLEAFVSTLRMRINDSKIMFGCYFPGRNYINENGTLGMFTNVLPIAFEEDDDEAKVIQDTFAHQSISQSKIYQLVPFDMIYDGELFDICFNYQNDWICMQGQDVISKIETMNFNPDITERPFYFGVIEENGYLKYEISYDGGRYSHEFIKEFVTDMEKNMQCIIGKALREQKLPKALKEAV